jgi:hypothetical protein
VRHHHALSETILAGLREHTVTECGAKRKRQFWPGHVC